MPSQFGSSKMKKKKKLPLPLVIAKQVDKAVTLLHSRGIVFGDLRNGNIIYIKRRDGDSSTEDRVMLVDFDWAGSHDVDRYSATLNILGGWAETVFPHAIMRKEHDLWQMEPLKKLCDNS